ncbi:hypothetical protein GCM10018781_07400 [Kitasatospora indigofera]|uniref:Uncharacterized protein n=1 Tax=Kitasatospora indigofera TaxID=67307 RepID=A0A919KKE2_9ACTN|nr:hypothetical protein GCM10018781_07400 [Kitasatospora indigofera]
MSPRRGRDGSPGSGSPPPEDAPIPATEPALVPERPTVTWLRILTAAAILLGAASVVAVFALCTSAARGDRSALPEPDTETAARESGLFAGPEDQHP